MNKKNYRCPSIDSDAARLGYQGMYGYRCKLMNGHEEQHIWLSQRKYGPEDNEKIYISRK